MVAVTAQDPQKVAECSLELGHELLRDLRWTQAECLELHQVRAGGVVLGSKCQRKVRHVPQHTAKDRFENQIDLGYRWKFRILGTRFGSDFGINPSSVVAVPNFDTYPPDNFIGIWPAKKFIIWKIRYGWYGCDRKLMKTPTLDGWITLDPENDPRIFGAIKGHKGPSKSDFRCRFPQEGIRAVCGSYPAAHRLGFALANSADVKLEVGSRTEKPALCEEKR